MASRRPGRILASMRRPAEQHPDDPLYDLAPIAPDPAAPAPARASKLSRATVSPAAMSPATLAYRAPREDVPGKADPETIKNLYMPLWLLGGGVVVQVIAIFLSHRHAGIEAALIAVGLQIIVGTTLMLVGILIAARFRGIALGPFWVAVFK